jgi:aminoglycoside phosphotransferase (APT) family kinase protein
VVEARDTVRRVDWRYLLDDARLRTVVTLDDSDVGSIREACEQVGAKAVGTSGEHSGATVVFARDPLAADIDRALGLRGADGAIVIQATSRRRRRAVERHMVRAGLAVHTYGCWPSCAGATRFVPLGDRSELIASAGAAKNRRRRALGCLVARLGLGRLLFAQSTSVAVAGDRSHVPAPLRVAFGDGVDVGGRMTLLTPRFSSSRHVIAMLTDRAGRPLVAKTPRIPGDDGQLSLEARGLTSITGPRPARPELVADTERFGQRWLVQTRIEGVPLSRRHVADHPLRWVAAAEHWLRDMPAAGMSTPDEDGRSERLIQPALDVITACSLREPELRELVADAERAFALLRSTPLPVVGEHGDFRPPNLVITGADTIGAVDWELAERHGFPLHDLLFFHEYVADVVPQLRSALSEVGLRALRSHGIEPELLGPLSTLASLRQLANAVTRGIGLQAPDAAAVASSGPVARNEVARAWFAAVRDRRLDDHPEVSTP